MYFNWNMQAENTADGTVSCISGYGDFLTAETAACRAMYLTDGHFRKLKPRVCVCFVYVPNGCMCLHHSAGQTKRKHYMSCRWVLMIIIFNTDIFFWKHIALVVHCCTTFLNKIKTCFWKQVLQGLWKCLLMISSNSVYLRAISVCLFSWYIYPKLCKLCNI